MSKIYDRSNVFCKIINKQIPCKLIYEDDAYFCFYDINPKAKTHALLIPKAELVDFDDFIENSTKDQVCDFFTKAHFVAKEILKLNDYQLHTNNGAGAGQVVFHFHLHILAN
jgi:histidine triad (HIT) family protein